MKQLQNYPQILPLTSRDSQLAQRPMGSMGMALSQQQQQMGGIDICQMILAALGGNIQCAPSSTNTVMQVSTVPMEKIPVCGRIFIVELLLSLWCLFRLSV